MWLRNHWVYYWCVNIAQCVYMEHELKYITLNVQRHIEPQAMYHNPPLVPDKPLGAQDKEVFITHRPYHGCWWYQQACISVSKISKICHARELLRFTRYCLSQWISKLLMSFEIHWVRPYLVNIVSFGMKELHASEMTVKLKSLSRYFPNFDTGIWSSSPEIFWSHNQKG